MTTKEVSDGGRRSGITIIELLVVVGILALLVGLLLPAVQKIREAAKSIESSNRLRQLSFCIHSYAADHSGLLPFTHPNADVMASRPNDLLFVALLPYLEQSSFHRWYLFERIGPDWQTTPAPTDHIPAFLNPLDPTWPIYRATKPDLTTPAMLTSYVASALVFRNGPSTAFISDGLSNTIFLSERYAHYHNGFHVNFTAPGGCSEPRIVVASYGTAQNPTPPTFSDGFLVNRSCGDDEPITSGNPPLSLGSRSRTFQHRPSPFEIDPRLLQATSTRGLIVALGDGSVRFLSPGISEAVFWSAVTPSESEPVVLD